MIPDCNEAHFLTKVTGLSIPQRMNSFNKEEKVNFVKWYYSGLSFRASNISCILSGATNSKFDISDIIHYHLWLLVFSPRLHFTAILLF
jgi:hypothetical protein